MKTKSFRIDLFDISVHGVEEELIDRFYFRDLLIKLLKYDEFAKAVDEITGSKISTKRNFEDRKEELKMIIPNVSRGVIAMNLAIKFLSYLADKGLKVILDEYWMDKLNKFEGFGNEKK
ncbi:MAG: hypothetical protein IKB06_02985 [Clostridia bacterium]|nr:hypothetical protein [Clostridia bacterium]